jgi:hypothetical protein
MHEADRGCIILTAPDNSILASARIKLLPAPVCAGARNRRTASRTNARIEYCLPPLLGVR